MKYLVNLNDFYLGVPLGILLPLSESESLMDWDFPLVMVIDI